MKNSTIGLYSEILAEYERLPQSMKAIEAYAILSDKYFLSAFSVRNAIKKIRKYKQMEHKYANNMS